MFTSPILFIGAHPDDIEINAGGTVARLLSEGHTIYSLILTNGSSEIRSSESNNALSMLGIPEENQVHLNFVDTVLYLDVCQIIIAIEKVIKQFKIGTIFTHHHADTHQDHFAVSQASSAAGRLVNNIIYYKPTYPSGRTDIPFNPNLYIKLSDEHVKTKVDSLRCHVSQILKYGNEDYIIVVEEICKADGWVYAGTHGYVELFQVSRYSI